MASYIALLSKRDDSDWTVEFPDFPGCMTAGKTLDEARAMAAEVLAFHIAGMVEDDDDVPEPSSLDSIMQDADYRSAVAFLVDARVPAVARKNVTVSLSGTVLRDLDTIAKHEGETRSGAIALLVRQVSRRPVGGRFAAPNGKDTTKTKRKLAAKAAPRKKR